jgi:hypothetical protein
VGKAALGTVDEGQDEGLNAVFSLRAWMKIEHPMKSFVENHLDVVIIWRDGRGRNYEGERL